MNVQHYMEAAILYAIASPPQTFSSPQTIDGLRDYLVEYYNVSFHESFVETGLKGIEGTEALSIIRDPFAGVMLKFDNAKCTELFIEKANNSPMSPFDNLHTTGKPYLTRVFNNENFWAELSDYQDSDSLEVAEKASVPASDRIVTIDHNQSDVIKITEGIEEIGEVFRGINSAKIDEGVKNRLSNSLEAASQLWSSCELKLTQINVGILMTLEEIEPYLKDTAKAATIAGIIELIKIFLTTSL